MITIESVVSGKPYAIGLLTPGALQYADREYRFAYIPQALQGCPFILTHGNDKMADEASVCFTVQTDRPYEVYILYPDKQPVIPSWLTEYERVRMNITRTDSDPMTLKGYFSLYRKTFPAGRIVFYGNSPKAMLADETYVASGGTNYCMYSVAFCMEKEEA